MLTASRDTTEVRARGTVRARGRGRITVSVGFRVRLTPAAPLCVGGKGSAGFTVMVSVSITMTIWGRARGAVTSRLRGTLGARISCTEMYRHARTAEPWTNAERYHKPDPNPKPGNNPDPDPNPGHNPDPEP